MRIKVAAVILIVFGIALAAALLIDNRIMAPAQLATIKTACAQCHSEAPDYGTALNLHAKKAAFNCSRCHSAVVSLAVTDNTHRGLQWLSVGTLLSALTGIIASLFVFNRSSEVKANNGTTQNRTL